MNSLDRGISVRYIYSACIVTTTKDVKILNDPWFTDGIYDGSWFHYPVPKDPIRSIGDVDLIYISHIHPDHYDPEFLGKYFAVYGMKQLIIADHAPNYLAGKMRADGFNPTILKEAMKIGSTTIKIIPHCTGSIADIDSAIIVKYFDGEREHCVANANDVIFEDNMTRAMAQEARGCDVLLCGYTGAGPFPQTYFDIDDPILPIKAEEKKLAFFERYRNLISALQPKVTIPFAGQYLLGGKLVSLNPYRGVADAVEVLALDKNAAVLDEGGTLSTCDLQPDHLRTKPFAADDIKKREVEIVDYRFDYERLIPESEIHQLPLKRLLATAVKKARERSECTTDYYFVIHLPKDELAIINSKQNADPVIQFSKAGTPMQEPRSEIFIDPRYLFGLLTNIYHWNNAEVGSQYQTRRYPNVLNRSAQAFLSFLAV